MDNKDKSGAATQASIPAGLKLNINDSFEVTLTARGAQTRNDHYAWMREKHPNVAPKLSCEGDVLKDQLWELMKIFGPSIHLGMEVPFANCEMRVVGKPAAPTSQAESVVAGQQVAALVPKWAGQFSTFEQWVSTAQRVLSVPDHKPKAICVDAKGRRCHIGADMARARDDGAFPVRYFWECELAAAPSSLPMAADARDELLEQAVEAADSAYLNAQCAIERGEFSQPIRQTREAIEVAIRQLKGQRPASQEGGNVE